MFSRELDLPFLSPDFVLANVPPNCFLQLTLPDADLNLMENLDVHIHFPAGAVGKDGPSAGITIVTALVSLFTQRVVKEGMSIFRKKSI